MGLAFGIFVLAIIAAIIGWIVARRKNRCKVCWAFFSFWFWPLLLILLALETIEPEPEPEPRAPSIRASRRPASFEQLMAAKHDAEARVPPNK